jgi:signal transduction histidine kinase
VLDDDSNLREMLREVMLLEGYEVDTAGSLQAGRAVIDQHWDAALIDVRLGSQNGLDFLRELRLRHPHVVALVLTGFSTPNVALSALRAGADDYFGKPVDLEKIKIAVRRGIDRVQASEQNRALVNDLHGMHEKLRQARALLSRRGVSSVEESAAYLQLLAEGASREVRAPLAAIRTSLDVLRETNGIDDAAFELIDYALGEANKIEHTLSNLVMLVRPGADAAPIDLTEVLQAVTRFAGGEMSGRNIHARVEPGEVARVVGDPWRLSRAVLNLLLFSIERMPEGGEIAAQIRVDPEANQAECRMADTGPSVADEKLEALFEPFDPRSSGALGLPAARGIIEEIGGRLWAESRPAGGMVFVLRLPLESAAAGQ